MRAKPHLAAALTVLAGAFLAIQLPAVPAAGAVVGHQATETAQPSATPTGMHAEPSVTPTNFVDPPPTGTPVVDPVPPPVPVHLPVALRDHDFKAPGPLVAAAEGYLAPLAASGRLACHPATHVLRETDAEGASTVVVAYALRPDDPSTALDLYMGSLVELSGIEGLAPADCPFTVRSMGVDRVRILDRPGGGPPPTSLPGPPR